MTVDLKRSILAQFSFYDQSDERLRREMEAATALVRLEAGQSIFNTGSECDKVVFLGRGDVRVSKVGETGRQIVLYRLRAGEACFLNVACVVAGVRYPADAITDSPTEALAVSPDVFLGWFEKAAPMRSFVLRMMSDRFIELLVRLEDVALTRLDRRLASFLVERARSEGDTLHLTHETIASELGSAREVISRRLKDLEQRGFVRLHRGAVEILEASALESLAS